MDDLIKEIAETLGVAEEKAKIAVETVLAYLQGHHEVGHDDPEKAKKVAAMAATTAAVNATVLPHHT